MHRSPLKWAVIPSYRCLMIQHACSRWLQHAANCLVPDGACAHELGGRQGESYGGKVHRVNRSLEHHNVETMDRVWKIILQQLLLKVAMKHWNSALLANHLSQWESAKSGQWNSTLIGEFIMRCDWLLVAWIWLANYLGAGNQINFSKCALIFLRIFEINWLQSWKTNAW